MESSVMRDRLMSLLGGMAVIGFVWLCVVTFS